MTYIIQKTDGTVLTTILDGNLNRDTGLTLIGRNFPNYGDYQNENFVRLLENFASPVPPSQGVSFTPLAGQLWWDTANQRLKVFNGVDFVNVSERTTSATAPEANVKLGDQWYDTTNRQLKLWNGTEWMVISPLYTYAQRKSGATVETVTDINSVTHTVVNTYTNGNLISVTSFDPTFVTTSYNSFDYIQPGINLASNVVLNGNVTDSQRLGGIFANAYSRLDINSAFTKDVSVNGNLVLTNANISFNGADLVVKNNQLSGNIAISVTTPLGEVTGLKVEGSTGLVTVVANPSTAMGIATKGYVDDIESSLINSYTHTDAVLAADIATLRADTVDYITANMAMQSYNLTTTQSVINANVTALQNSTNDSFATLNANVGDKTTRIESIESTLPLKADLDSPVLTGNPTTPTPLANNNSTTIASTAYVTSAVGVATTNFNNQISALAATTAINLSNGLATKSDIESPAFTGLATAPTPSPGDNSTRIATTGFVTQAISAQKFNYTVSSGPPSGGNDGDFWFQVG